jgi:hypothetical protein
MSSETSSRVSGDASLASNLSTEVSDLNVSIDNEKADRQSADTSLESYIDSEISTEASTRTSADASLATAISDIVAAADYGKTTVGSQPDGTTKNFNIGPIEEGTAAVYLNGLLQFEGDDYVEVAGSGPQAGMTVRIDFTSEPKSGSKLQVLGSVI